MIVDLNGKASSLTYTGSDLEKYFGTSTATNMEVTDSKSGGSLTINGGLFADGRSAPYGNIQFKKGTITIDPKGNAIGKWQVGSAILSIEGADVIIPKEVNSQGGKVFLDSTVSIKSGSFTWEGADIKYTSNGHMTLNMTGGTATVGKLNSMGNQINGGVLNGDVADPNIKIKGGRINGSVTGYTKIQLPYQEGEKISIENTFWAYKGELTSQDWNAADSEKADGKVTLWIRNGYDQKITIGSTVYEYKWNEATSSFSSTAGATVKLTYDLSYSASLPQGYDKPPKFSITAEKTELAKSTDTITYQWYENNQKISSATEPSYTMPIGKVAGEYTYYCDVTCGDYSMYSGIAKVKVVDAVAGVVINGNNSYYDNLESAFAAVPQGGKSTITLLKDINLGTGHVPNDYIKGDITLNLNGKTLSSSGTDGVIAPKGAQSYPITITGSGTIKYTGGNSGVGAIKYFLASSKGKLTVEDNVQIVTDYGYAVRLGYGADLQIKDNAKLITSSSSSPVIYGEDSGSNIIIDGGTLQNTNTKKIINYNKLNNANINVVINKAGVIMKEGSIEAANIFFNVANDGVLTTGSTWYPINTDAINSNKMEVSAGDNTTTNDNLLYGKKGETVSFTAKAKAGYLISDIATVTEGSTTLNVTKTQGDYTSAQNTCTFSFIMPSNNGVAVSVPLKLENCLKLVGGSISKAYNGTTFELSTTKGTHFTWSGTGTATIEGYYTDNTGSNQTTEENSGTATNGGAPKNAGTYYAKVSVSADDVYAAATVYVPFTITQSGTTFDGGIKTYKDNTVTNTFNYGDTITVKVTPKATGTAPMAKGLQAILSFSAPTANQMALFVGEKQITDPVNATGGVYTMTYDTKAKDLVVGSNTITAKYVGNSNMADYSENITVTLNKKAITSAVVNTSDFSASKEYNGANSFTSVALTTLEGVESGDTVKATADGTVTDVNVGTDKAFTAISVTLDGDHKDYYSLDKAAVNGNVSITQATAAGVNQELQAVKGLEKEYTFDLTKLLPALSEGKSFGDIAYTVGTVTNTDNVLAQNPTSTDIVNGKITLKVANIADKDKISAIQIKVTSKNYKDFTADLNVKTTDKLPLTVETAFTGGTYNGKPYAYTGTPTFKNGTEAVSGITYTAKYVGRDGTIYDESETAPTNAGSYNLIISIPTDNEIYTGKIEIPFTISKKDITVKANDKSIYVGGSIPENSALTYTVTGLIGNDTLKTVPTLTLDAKAVSTSAGSYTITVAGAAVGDNYNLTIENGTFNVTAAPYIPPYNPPAPTSQPTTETREIPVVVDNGGAQTNAVQVPVTRVTDTDGRKTDIVKFDQEKAKETVTKALETKTHTATISVTDIPGNNADKVDVNVPQSSMTELGSNNIALDVKTEKAALELPKETVFGLKDKDAKIEISEVKDSSKDADTKGLILKLASGSEILSNSLNIEANFTGRTKITLPIETSKLPASKEELGKFISSLAVVVQHSDGENTVDKGTIVYDSKGNPIGLSIWVNKFSTFTLVELPDNYFDGRTTIMPDKVAPDKEWHITFTKPADKSTLTPENVYVLDSAGNKVDVKISYGSDNVLRVAPVNNYKSGETYYLYISNKVTSKNKTPLPKALKFQFTIK
ncbi:Ig-like domain-containing protein [Clostridium scatologenes]|nr:MBG domain-containing protein [Clostridium scatologenes]